MHEIGVALRDVGMTLCIPSDLCGCPPLNSSTPYLVFLFAADHLFTSNLLRT
jgi:hypothetical protein